MKKFVLIFIFFWVQISVAQIVNIPDANFKIALIEEGVDTNNDGEIQFSEAEAVTSLILVNKDISSIEGILSFKNLVSLDCGDNNISSLEILGLQDLSILNMRANPISSFYLDDVPNLIELNIGGIQLTSIDLSELNGLKKLFTNVSKLVTLDLSTLTNLEHFECSLCFDLEALNLSGLTNLDYLFCSNSKLTELDLSNLYNLREASIRNNQSLTSIDLSGCIKLGYIDASSNSLTSIDLNGLTSLGGFNLNNNQLTSLENSSSLTRVIHVNASGNQLTSLDFSASELQSLVCDSNQLTSLDLSNQPKLTRLFCRNNQLTSLDLSNQLELEDLLCNSNQLETLNIKNGTVEGLLQLSNNLNLRYVCVDPEQQAEIQNLVNSSCVVNSFCTFEPGGDVYYVEGSVKVDIDQDGCDSDDLGFPLMQIKVADTNGNLGIYSSESDGSYSIALPEGDYTIDYQFPYMSYFDVSPSSFSVNFPTDTSPFIQDICITPSGNYNDLQIAIIPLEGARPGFDTSYKIVYANVGTSVLSGDVIFNFDDDVLDFVSASINPDTQNTGELSWSFSNLAPFDIKTLDVTMNLNAPTETPPLNDGDILCYEAIITPTNNDEIPNDNSFSLKQTVVNSYDPNDKTCLEGDVITPDLVGEYVHYLIRFENTGSASAVNIVVKDVIDTNKFEMESFVPMNSSHDFVTRIQNDNEVEFIFEGINLPFDDANNDGFVLFKIKTLPTLVLGDTFENSAEIYFDFNFPIITNVEQTTIDTTASTDDFTLNSNITVYPNPADNQLKVESQIEFDAVVIYDLTGKEIHRIISTENRLTQEIDVSKLKSGIYYLSIHSGNSKTTEKFLKI